MNELKFYKVSIKLSEEVSRLIANDIQTSNQSNLLNLITDTLNGVAMQKGIEIAVTTVANPLDYTSKYHTFIELYAFTEKDKDLLIKDLGDVKSIVQKKIIKDNNLQVPRLFEVVRRNGYIYSSVPRPKTGRRCSMYTVCPLIRNCPNIGAENTREIKCKNTAVFICNHSQLNNGLMLRYLQDLVYYISPNGIYQYKILTRFYNQWLYNLLYSNNN